MSTFAGTPPSPARWRRFSLAPLAGADLNVLRRAPSERGFYEALGGMVLLISCASGFAVCLAISYALQVPATRVWWLGAAWTLIMALGVERFVLQIAPAKPHWLLVGLLPRLGLSVLVAIGMEPLILRLNQSEINGYLTTHTNAAIRAMTTGVAHHYEPLIASNYRQIADLRSHLEARTNTIEHFRFLSQCEATTRSCSTTKQLGCGAYCGHYRRVAEHTEAQLRREEPAVRARM